MGNQVSSFAVGLNIYWNLIIFTWGMSFGSAKWQKPTQNPNLHRLSEEEHDNSAESNLQLNFHLLLMKSCSGPICPVWTCLIFLFSLGCFGSWVWEMVDECVLWESLKEGRTACYQSCLVNMITAFTLHHIKSQMLCDISTIVNSKEAFLKCSDPSLKLDACCQRWKRQRSDLRELVAEGANVKLAVLWLLREEAEMRCHLLQLQWGSLASLQLCLWWNRYGCLATASGESSAFNLCLPLS